MSTLPYRKREQIKGFSVKKIDLEVKNSVFSQFTIPSFRKTCMSMYTLNLLAKENNCPAHFSDNLITWQSSDIFHTDTIFING